MVTAEEAHKTATRLLTCRLLLLLRLSTTIKEATHKLSGNATNTPRCAAGMRTLTAMLPTQQRARKPNERRLILRLLFASGERVHCQILILATSNKNLELNWY